MNIVPQSSPNWKEGLLIVLLSFFVWKIENISIKILFFLLFLALLINYLFIAYFLFKYNIFGLITKISFLKDGKLIITTRSESFKCFETSHKKIPFNNSYVVTLYKDDWTSKKIVLNESELSKLTFILEN